VERNTEGMTLVADKQRVKDSLKEWGVLTEVLTTPIVFHPGGWEDTLPEHIKQSVLEQRLEKVINGGWDSATDAEVVCYLYTASLVQPFNSDWTDIYLYEAATLMPQIRQAIPATPKELSDYQKHQLSDLKRNIRDSQKRRRKSNRKEKDMSKRKLVMEEEDGSVLVGVMQEGCDPIIKTKEGSIEEVLPAVPDFLKEAQEKWAVSPRGPAYKAPVPVKAVAAATPAAEQPTRAEDLPLLSGTGKAVGEQAEVPTEVPTEVSAEEKPAEAVAEGTEQLAAPAETEPEPEVPATEPEAVEPAVSGVEEEKTEQELSERIAQAPAPQPAEATPSTAAKLGEWEYYLEDGRGPFESVQLAMDALGLDKDTRPQHNRWDRLSTALKEKIQRRPKS